MALMMDWAFSAGYRRCEWKCNALNLGSRRAAARLGFSFEGVLRNHMVIKGRNPDSAWFSGIDTEWPALKAAFGHWLDPANFDAAGRQRTPLSKLPSGLRASQKPGMPTHWLDHAARLQALFHKIFQPGPAVVASPGRLSRVGEPRIPR